MRCPFCGHLDTQVKDSRPSEDGKTIRRRRECSACSRRFTTFERFQVQQVLVVKRDGQRELFEREKLFKSVSIALQKRPINQALVMEMVSDIEQTFSESGRTEIPSQEVGDAVMERLKKLDYVGFIRYASVYNDFKTPEDFQKIISEQ